MPGGDDAKRAWIEHVLGVRIAGEGPAPPRPAAGWRGARESWQQASEAVDNQISGLQSALLATQDAELKEIAEFGLNAMTGGYKVRMMAALADLGDAGPAASQDGAAKALALVQGLKSQIESDERVAACDANPFGVAIAIRATLGPALDGLAAALRPAHQP